MTAAFVSTLLLLGIVGWIAGWVAAGGELERQAQVDPTTSAQTSKPPTSSPPSNRPSPTASPSSTATPLVTPSRPDQFEMPNLVNKDFKLARLEARALRLGVNVTFNEPGNKPDGTVVSTKPEARTYVWPGVEIQLNVAGPPPRVFVPQVVGMTCEEAKDKVLDSGLKILQYPSGQRGKVTNLDPSPGTALKWNDGVKIFCVG